MSETGAGRVSFGRAGIVGSQDGRACTMFGLGQFDEAGGLGTDEVLEALEAASAANGNALDAANGALDAIGSAASLGTDEEAGTASATATSALDDLVSVIQNHSQLLISLVNAGVATASIFQRVQSEVNAAKDKKAELEAQLAALRAHTPTAPAPTSTTTVTVGSGATPAAAGPNYAAYGLAALLAAGVAWYLAGGGNRMAASQNPDDSEDWTPAPHLTRAEADRIHAIRMASLGRTKKMYGEHSVVFLEALEAAKRGRASDLKELEG